jgi:Putative beta barrel porin-7 (BBP7)
VQTCWQGRQTARIRRGAGQLGWRCFDLPIRRISAHSRREKSIRHGAGVHREGCRVDRGLRPQSGHHETIAGDLLSEKLGPLGANRRNWTGSQLSLKPGQQATFNCSARDQYGHPFPAPELSWAAKGGGAIGYNLTYNLRATVGYTFLYWNTVARPGDQIDTSLNLSQLDSGGLVGPARPRFDGITTVNGERGAPPTHPNQRP